MSLSCEFMTLEQMLIQDNTMMAGADEFHIQIQGRGGHGEHMIFVFMIATKAPENLILHDAESAWRSQNRQFSAWQDTACIKFQWWVHFLACHAFPKLYPHQYT